ncbi:MAG: S8 family serine peptidase, partial [Candidatus Baltobacteraceae bacterium]
LSPANLQAAYSLPSASKGSGQIVAVVNAYDNPNVASDLAQYRSTFGLPAANFSKYNQQGQQSHYPSGSNAWGILSDLSVEMVSASCPNCTIYLVEANSSAGSDLDAAEDQAVKLGAHIVSNGWTCSGSSQCVDQSHFEAKNVEYLASAGDGGSSSAGFPAAFDTVTAVGGTELSQGRGKRGWSEKIFGASGGCTTQPKPAWQHLRYCAGRLTNDAGAVAWNVAAYDTYGFGGWVTLGGTSISAPLLAGVFGLAGNAAKQNGGRTFWLKAHQKHLYPIAGGSGCAFHQGQYNTCTGWGSPNGIGAF